MNTLSELGASKYSFAMLLIFVMPLMIIYNQKWKYYFKYFIYYSFVLLTSAMLIPIFLCRPKNVLNTKIAAWCVSKLNYLYGIEWHILGKEHILVDRAAVIVANHQSSLDLLGMFELWPLMNKCAAIAKRQLLYIFPFGVTAYLCGTIFIDRSNTAEAKASMKEAQNKVMHDKIKLWVFPEGTRNCDGKNFLPFKKGGFHFAVDCQIPIIPVVYSPLLSIIDPVKKKFTPGKVFLNVLPPISTVGMGTQDIEKLVGMVQKQMIDTFRAQQ